MRVRITDANSSPRVLQKPLPDFAPPAAETDPSPPRLVLPIVERPQAAPTASAPLPRNITLPKSSGHLPPATAAREALAPGPLDRDSAPPVPPAAAEPDVWSVHFDVRLSPTRSFQSKSLAEDLPQPVGPLLLGAVIQLGTKVEAASTHPVADQLKADDDHVNNDAPTATNVEFWASLRQEHGGRSLTSHRESAGELSILVLPSEPLPRTKAVLLAGYCALVPLETDCEDSTKPEQASDGGL